ncbi:triple gene block protein 1 [Panax ginseng flexivirus 1]|uniref:triple gene block protein 1 n=1 Tax=Panax ginseng flexivirus 1 TaxID=2303411 RepID=UPI000E331D11|nr:triple gene block protein 1 [Panax ginseng flexivirus 1]AXN92353.1 triple gene block protein 1 [Panax ginseng flexivirus 1]
MNNLLAALDLYNFECVSDKLSFPLVIHCVPGGGKTSLIRDLIKIDSNFVAFTAGEPDIPNLEGKYIKRYSKDCAVKGKLNILDEYLTAEDWTGFSVLFSDPFQNVKAPLEAHFVGSRSRRFGKETCKYLRNRGFEVNSTSEDTVVIGSPFEVKTEGQLICFGKGAIDLAVSHSASFKLPCEVRGSTFEVVTVLKSEEPNSENLHLFYIALTRHKHKLIILE